MSAPVPLVLASASPARRTTLAAAGIDPVVVVSEVDEPAVVERYGATAAEDVALLLARAKAEDVASRVDDGPPVLGCDSVLEVGGEAQGKPVDAEQAIARWKRMRGGSAVLHTGHWVVDTRPESTGGTLGAVASTLIHFADVEDDEIAAYVATGEPLAVAGACTIDGFGGAYVTGIEGDHHNVVGLSLPLLRSLVRDLGIPWHHLWRRA